MPVPIGALHVGSQICQGNFPPGLRKDAKPVEAPAIARGSEDIGKVGEFQTIVPGAEKGKFYCEGGGDGTLPQGKCGKDLSSAATRVMNNGEDYVLKCGRCGRTLYFNAGWLAAKVLLAQQLKAKGQTPAVGRTFDDVKETSTVREEPLPDGRKRIIITPAPAIQVPRVSRGEAVVR